MADTLPTYTLTDEWTSANTLTGIAIGTAMTIQNQGATQILYAAAPSAPDPTFMGVIIPPRLDRPLMVASGESEIWLRSRFPASTARANVQEG